MRSFQHFLSRSHALSTSNPVDETKHIQSARNLALLKVIAKAKHRSTPTPSYSATTSSSFTPRIRSASATPNRYCAFILELNGGYSALVTRFIYICHAKRTSIALPPTSPASRTRTNQFLRQAPTVDPYNVHRGESTRSHKVWIYAVCRVIKFSW